MTKLLKRKVISLYRIRWHLRQKTQSSSRRQRSPVASDFPQGGEALFGDGDMKYKNEYGKLCPSWDLDNLEEVAKNREVDLRKAQQMSRFAKNTPVDRAKGTATKLRRTG